jgi:general secretion pathway protein M
MSADATVTRFFARFPWVAVGLYVLVVIFCAVAIWGAVADVLEYRAQVASAHDILDQLRGGRPTRGRGAGFAEGTHPGSPFLEGRTVTVAGAALLQRVAGTVTKLGGNVLSSQEDLQSSQFGAGFIGVIASCEIKQTALQELLYDLETGMPFLFIDQLVVQAAAATSASEEDRLRVLISVRGQWEGKK